VVTWIKVLEQLPDLSKIELDDMNCKSVPVIFCVQNNENKTQHTFIGNYFHCVLEEDESYMYPNGEGFNTGGGDWDINFLKKFNFSTDSLFYCSNPGTKYIVTHWSYINSPEE